MVIQEKKPEITWILGLLSYFETQSPYDLPDVRRMGFDVGRQVVGLYLAEMLLKYSLDRYGTPHRAHHNLLDLYLRLPRDLRPIAEQKYKELLNAELEWTWDVYESVESFLSYLGRNAIKDTRYFWERGIHHYAPGYSILIAPQELRLLIYCLLIALHGFPEKPLERRFKTTFRPLE